jgi:hypothetical protein
MLDSTPPPPPLPLPRHRPNSHIPTHPHLSTQPATQQAARQVRLMPQPPASPASPASGRARLLRYPGKLPHHAVTLSLLRLIMFQFSTRLPCLRTQAHPRPVPPSSPRITLQCLPARRRCMAYNGLYQDPKRPWFQLSLSPPLSPALHLRTSVHQTFILCTSHPLLIHLYPTSPSYNTPPLSPSSQPFHSLQHAFTLGHPPLPLHSPAHLCSRSNMLWPRPHKTRQHNHPLRPCLGRKT